MAERLLRVAAGIDPPPGTGRLPDLTAALSAAMPRKGLDGRLPAMTLS